MPLTLAQQTSDVSSWAPVALLLVIAIGFAVGNLVISLVIGPSRTGAVKESTYESGMVPIGDAKRRFNVRFYLVAMIFLVIDVEIVFLYPWATAFPHAVQNDPVLATSLLVSMLIFTVLLLDSYVYAWGKGVFRWD